jgi:hypothetical protein
MSNTITITDTITSTDYVDYVDYVDCSENSIVGFSLLQAVESL